LFILNPICSWQPMVGQRAKVQDFSLTFLSLFNALSDRSHLSLDNHQNSITLKFVSFQIKKCGLNLQTYLVVTNWKSKESNLVNFLLTLLQIVSKMTVSTALSQYEIERNKPMPNRIHGVIQNKIGFLLQLHFGKKYQFVDELNLDTKPGTTPDICMYPKKKLSLITIETKETEAPITTIEIQSPSQSPDELVKKAWNHYFPMGVQSAWIVIPALKAIQILLPDGQKVLFTSGILKDPVTGIELNLDEIFEELE
jgi:Uma2 family endonuclease